MTTLQFLILGFSLALLEYFSQVNTCCASLRSSITYQEVEATVNMLLVGGCNPHTD